MFFLLFNEHRLVYIGLVVEKLVVLPKGHGVDPLSQNQVSQSVRSQVAFDMSSVS